MIEVTSEIGSAEDAQDVISTISKRTRRLSLMLGGDDLRQLQIGLRVLSDNIGDERFVQQSGVTAGVFVGPQGAQLTYFVMMDDSSHTFVHFKSKGEIN